jgi:hypothetical protein
VIPPPIEGSRGGGVVASPRPWAADMRWAGLEVAVLPDNARGEDLRREGCRTGENSEEQEVGCHTENTSEEEEGGHHVVRVLGHALA